MTKEMSRESCVFFLAGDLEIQREEVEPRVEERELERGGREGDVEKERTKELTGSTIE